MTAMAARMGFMPEMLRRRGLLTAVFVFIVLLVAVNLLSAAPMGYFDVSYMSAGGTTLALAAIGQTLVILTGGFDLSAAHRGSSAHRCPA